MLVFFLMLRTQEKNNVFHIYEKQVLYSKISFKPKGSKCFFCLISSATLAQVLKSSCLQPITLYLLKKGSIFS